MVLNQASDIMLGNQEVQRAYLGQTLVWERKKDYDDTKIAIIKLNNNYRETNNVEYVNTLAKAQDILEANKSNNYKVVIGEKCGITSITSQVFYYDITGNGLYEIVIPDTVTSIKRSAFYNCRKLAIVRGGNQITSIGVFAFGYCLNLTSITFSDSLKAIGNYAFYF